MKKILVSWIGRNSLKAIVAAAPAERSNAIRKIVSQYDAEVGVSHVKMLLNHVTFDEIFWLRDYLRDEDFIIKEMMASNNWQKPTKPFDQLKIFGRLTGFTKAFGSKAKCICKGCYVLLNAIRAFRNRTVHPEGQATYEGAAVSTLLVCVELMNCLERELG